jgi:hypothetical protein
MIGAEILGIEQAVVQIGEAIQYGLLCAALLGAGLGFALQTLNLGQSFIAGRPIW